MHLLCVIVPILPPRRPRPYSCGFPDFATRAFVRQLHERLRLPVLGLADLNPFGIAILACYR